MMTLTTILSVRHDNIDDNHVSEHAFSPNLTKALRMDQRTNQQADKAFYRDARKHLKMNAELQIDC